jgi:hypothetical protein
MVSIVVLNIAAFNVERLGRITAGGPAPASALASPASPRWPGEVAEALFRAGLHQGDAVAVIGYGFDSYWARLARMQIVAEMFDWEAAPFWAGDPHLQDAVVRAFARTGARAIVAERVPVSVIPPGWKRIGDSSYYIYVLTNRSAAVPGYPAAAGRPSVARGTL